MNRTMRRLLGIKKKKHVNWTCPNCTHFYPVIYDQAHDLPYIFCFKSCEEYFDHKGKNVTKLLFPNGKPWEQKASKENGTK